MKLLNHLIRNNCVQVVFLSLLNVIYSPFAREGVFSALCMVSHVTLRYSMLTKSGYPRGPIFLYAFFVRDKNKVSFNAKDWSEIAILKYLED